MNLRPFAISFFFNLDYCEEIERSYRYTYQTHPTDYKSLKQFFFFNVSKRQLYFQTYILQSDALIQNVAVVQNNKHHQNCIERAYETQKSVSVI